MFYTDTLFLHFYQNVVFTGCIRYFFYIIPKENGHFLVENCNIFLQNNACFTTGVLPFAVLAV